MWIKINSLNAGDTNQNLIMSRGGWNTNGFRFGLVSSGSGFAFPQFWTSQSTPGGASGIGIESTKSVGSDRFYHLALTYNNGNASMYIDGHLSGSVTASQGVSPYYVIPVGSDLCLGGCMGGTTDSNSTYADVRYYSQSLLSDQIEKIYAESKTKYNE